MGTGAAMPGGSEALERTGGDALRTVPRWMLAVTMIGAGVGHFAVHDAFMAQTPSFLPARSVIVWVSGLIEIGLGLALLLARRRRALVGWSLAAFLVLVFSGNVYQAVAGIDGLGLETPTARWVRLLFQPLLVAWALWCTEAWPRPSRRRSP